MDNYRNTQDMTPEEMEVIRRRKIRIQQMKKEKERQLRLQRLVKKLVPVAAIAFVVLIAGIGMVIHTISVAGNAEKPIQQGVNGINVQAAGQNAEDIPGSVAENGEAAETEDTGTIMAGTDETDNQQVHVSAKQYSAHETSRTTVPPGEVESGSVIFLDRSNGDILAQRDCHAVINPASMTKVLTVLVAAEHISEADLDDKFTITAEITDYSFVHDCSNVGFEKGEQVTVRDLFYGTILPSGADAAVGLATYVAGSHEAFVDLMNEKLQILGLSDTAHFTNCVGIYDKDHHCTAYDMAMIMEAALDNELCREVLSAHTYTTSATAEHPEGLLISNWFLRRIEDQDTGGEVVCGKTGFVDQSGNCAVSFGIDMAGNKYVCVTAGAQGSWRCIYDHTALYKKFAKKTETESGENL